MDQRTSNGPATSSGSGTVVSGILRGALLGVVGAVALAVWAMNMEWIFAGNAGNLGEKVVRLLLCEAIPLATFIAVYNGIGRERSLREIFCGILASVAWFLGGFLLPRRVSLGDDVCRRYD